MERVLSSDCKRKIGERVLIKGWLYNFRKLGKIAFLVLRDRGGLIQVVLENKEEIKKISKIQNGSILEIEGKVVARNLNDEAEITNPKIKILKSVNDFLSIDLTKEEINAELDIILDYRPLTLRHIKQKAIFKLQAEIVKSFREYFVMQGFVEFFAPNIINSSSEGGAELFKIDYFGIKANLSQSAQLYKQIMVGVHERVFGLIKCFRAEKSATRRHLTEATQFEMEMGFIENMDDLKSHLENCLRYITKSVSENCLSELKLLNVSLPKLPDAKTFPSVTFKEALEIYFERSGIDERSEIDLSPGAEKELCKYAKEKYDSDYIFVTHFLKEKTPFYAKPNENDEKISNYFDLLCRECEIVSGGQRIDDYNELIESLKSKGLNPKDFSDYLSIFKFGMPKHGGFGMGLERLTMMFLGLDNIREATLFPSDLKRIAAKSIT